MKAQLTTIILTENETLNLSKMTSERGVLQLSIYNDGSVPFVIDDVSQQVIPPRGTFVVESDIPIVNTSFPICFLEKEEEENQIKKVIVRYVVPYCE